MTRGYTQELAQIQSSKQNKEKKKRNIEWGMVFQGGAWLDYRKVKKNEMFTLARCTNKIYKESVDRVNFC